MSIYQLINWVIEHWQTLAIIWLGFSQVGRSIDMANIYRVHNALVARVETMEWGGK